MQSCSIMNMVTHDMVGIFGAGFTVLSGEVYLVIALSLVLSSRSELFSRKYLNIYGWVNGDFNYKQGLVRKLDLGSIWEPLLGDNVCLTIG